MFQLRIYNYIIMNPENQLNELIDRPAFPPPEGAPPAIPEEIVVENQLVVLPSPLPVPSDGGSAPPSPERAEVSSIEDNAPQQVDFEAAPLEPRSRTLRGVIPSSPDSRDFLFENLYTAGKIKTRGGPLPVIWDARDHKIFQVRDQGNTSMCAAFSGAAMAEFNNLNDPEVDLKQYLSPAFIYNYKSTSGEGMMARDVCNILLNDGICLETLFHVGRSETKGSIPENIRTNALNYKVSSYAQILSLDGIKRSLADGHLVLFCTWCYSSNSDYWRGSPNQQPEGGHATVFIGYNDIDKYLVIRNSWGRSWGQNGYATISYDDFNALQWRETWSTIDFANITPPPVIPDDNQTPSINVGQGLKSKKCCCGKCDIM
jgi:hypothetical protein